MRITRESLHSIARETAEKYARRNRDLVCIYLTGSLLGDTPLLGGTTDIDLILVHASSPPYTREIIRLSDEIHLDLAHYPQTVFQQPRHLRRDPWIGANLCLNSQLLYDTQHWFEFTQASAGAQFDLPENVIGRARKLETEARQGWFDLQTQPGSTPAEKMHLYLASLENAANSISAITGIPLTERRFIPAFPARAAAIGRPGLASGLVDLFTREGFSADELSAWFEPWKACLKAASQAENVSPRMLPARLSYYERAAAALNEEDPAAAWWLVLRTWTNALLVLEKSSGHEEVWTQACLQVELGEAHFDQRLAQVDSYLDAVEDTLDNWSQKYGV